MTRRLWLWLVLLPLIVLGTWVGTMAWLHNNGNHAVIIHREALDRTEAVWEGFDYIPLSDRGGINRAINALVQGLSGLNESQTDATLELIHDILIAYGQCNWDAFKRFRFPGEDFAISDELAAALEEYCPDRAAAGDNQLQQYRLIWLDTFKNPLWTEVAFFDASLAIFDVARLDEVSSRFPEIGAKPDQNYVGQHKSATFQYPQRLKRMTDAGQRVTMLRFSFMGAVPQGKTVECRPFMFTFYWDTMSRRWIPNTFAQGYVRSPTHTIRFF